MRTNILAVTVGLSFLLVNAAEANPVSMQILRVRQVPKTTHVQVTYGSIDKNAPQELKRDGAVVTATWTALAAFNANTGSGVVPIAAQQFCDCNVAVGQHKYDVKFVSTGGGDVLGATIDVVRDYTLPGPSDAGVGKDLNPWEVPEPTQLQGLDCAARCAGGSPDAGAPVKPTENDSGCSLGGRPIGASLLLLAGLLLGALLLRRRR